MKQHPSKSILTNSSMGTFRSCPWKWWLKYVYGLRENEKGYALKFGSLYHAVLERIGKQEPMMGLFTGEDEFLDEAVKAVVAGRLEYYGNRPEEIVSVLAAEEMFEMPLRNPTTGRPTQSFTLGGKRDAIVRLHGIPAIPNGSLALLEYKTTVRDFSPGSDYWMEVRMSQQVSIYLQTARDAGHDVSTILYDVTKRPMQRPSQVPVLDENGMKIVHDANGERVKTSKGKWRETANKDEGYVLQTRPETPKEFGKRVKAAIDEDPSKWYLRLPIGRTDRDLKECALDVWQTQRMIRMAMNDGYYYRNPGSCRTMFGSCEYVGCCMNKDIGQVIPDGFHLVDDVHPELLEENLG